MANKRLYLHLFLGFGLLLAALPRAAALPCAAATQGCVCLRKPPNKQPALRQTVRALVQSSGFELLAPFVYTQVALAVVKALRKTHDLSINVVSFFLPRQLMERLVLYMCNQAVNRLARTSTELRFVVAQTVLIGWLVCTGRQVAPAFRLVPLLERFSVYLLMLVANTVPKSANADKNSRRNSGMQ
jgi:uncharacterized membrane protein